MEEFSNIQINEIAKVVMQIQNNDTHVIENCIKACKASYALFLKHNRISTDEENEASKRGHLIGDNSNRKME